MDKRIRKAQLEVLRVFSAQTKTFALAGGTALELYYLHHRFSWDLDIYVSDFDPKEMIVYLENEVKRFIRGELK